MSSSTGRWLDMLHNIKRKNKFVLMWSQHVRENYCNYFISDEEFQANFPYESNKHNDWDLKCAMAHESEKLADKEMAEITAKVERLEKEAQNIKTAEEFRISRLQNAINSDLGRESLLSSNSETLIEYNTVKSEGVDEKCVDAAEVKNTIKKEIKEEDIFESNKNTESSDETRTQPLKIIDQANLNKFGWAAKHGMAPNIEAAAKAAKQSREMGKGKLMPPDWVLGKYRRKSSKRKATATVTSSSTSQLSDKDEAPSCSSSTKIQKKVSASEDLMNFLVQPQREYFPAYGHIGPVGKHDEKNIGASSIGECSVNVGAGYSGTGASCSNNGDDITGPSTSGITRKEGYEEGVCGEDVCSNSGSRIGGDITKPSPSGITKKEGYEEGVCGENIGSNSGSKIGSEKVLQSTCDRDGQRSGVKVSEGVNIRGNDNGNGGSSASAQAGGLGSHGDETNSDGKGSSGCDIFLASTSYDVGHKGEYFYSGGDDSVKQKNKNHQCECQKKENCPCHCHLERESAHHPNHHNDDKDESESECDSSDIGTDDDASIVDYPLLAFLRHPDDTEEESEESDDELNVERSYFITQDGSLYVENVAPTPYESILYMPLPPWARNRTRQSESNALQANENVNGGATGVSDALPARSASSARPPSSPEPENYE